LGILIPPRPETPPPLPLPGLLDPAEKSDILKPMQGFAYYPLKPAFSRPNPSKFRFAAVRTVTSLGGGGASIFVFVSGGYPVKYTDPDGRISLFGFELFQTPQTGDAKLDAANKIVFGLAKVLLGKLITDGSISGGAALTGLSSGAATVAGVGIAIVGSAIGTAVSAEGLVDIADGALSLMQGNKYSNKAEPASEKTAIDMRKQIERDLGQNAGRDFHEMKEGPDRTPQQLKEDAASVYEDYGKRDLLPKWMTPE
jgi:hypothetical protein